VIQAGEERQAGSEVTETALFQALSATPFIRDYLGAFFAATNVPVRLVPPAGNDGQGKLLVGNRPLCKLLECGSVGDALCEQRGASALQRAIKARCPSFCDCGAGLTMLTIPVMENNQMVAALIAGPVLSRTATEQGFVRLMNAMQGDHHAEKRKRLKIAFFKQRVLSRQKLRFAATLLQVFARQVARLAAHYQNALQPKHCAHVASARDYVRANMNVRVTLGDVARHVQLSKSYFSRLFRRETGMTFMRYVLAERVEKSAKMLAESREKISHIAYATGFKSLGHFDAAFKKHMGKTPLQYRRALSQVSPRRGNSLGGAAMSALGAAWCQPPPAWPE
jgi:AraC-like DNA-binding protein/ligand-binding sensor protein